MKEENFQSLINYRLEQAREALEDAKLLLDAGRYRAAANRLYYACFYAVVAALLTRPASILQTCGGDFFFR